MSVPALPAEKEAQVQELAAHIREAIKGDLEDLARLLLSKSERDLFGDTEFEVRDLMLRMGAKGYQIYLAEKKTATREPESSVRTAGKRPSSRTTGPKRP